MGRNTVTFVLSALLLVGCLAVYALAGAATRSVDVQDDAFVDSVSGNSSTTITVGDTVQWTWSGSNLHTVDNNGGTESFSSGAPQTAGSFSHTFNTAGTYNYICGVHGTAMQGAIVVQAAQAPTSTPAPPSTSTPLPQASASPVADVTSTRTPRVAATPVAPSPASPAAPSAGGSQAAVTPAAPRGGGALPSAGHGPSGTEREYGLTLASLLIALIGGVGLGWIAFARRVPR